MDSGVDEARRVVKVTWEAIPGLVIPDDDPQGVSSTIAIDHSGTVEGIKVGVDITHTYIRDLRVTLMAPSGEAVILHDRAGGGLDDLTKTYDLSSTDALKSLTGQQARAR